MKKQHFIIFIFSVGIILSLTIPILFWIKYYYTHSSDLINSSILSELATFLTFILAFWGLALNAALVIIAYNAFKNFDVKKQFHNKQLEIVSELASQISGTTLSNMSYRISIDPNGREHQIMTGFTFNFFEIALGFNYSKYDMIVVLSNNIENTFPFLKFKNHPMLPKTIATELEKLYRPLQYSFPLDEENIPKNYVKLYGKTEVPESKKEEDFSRSWMYELYSNPKDFNKDALSLKNSITHWLNEFGADNLNF